MLARWTLLFTALALLAGLVVLRSKGSRAGEVALERQAERGTPSLKASESEPLTIATTNARVREAVHSPGSEEPVEYEADLLSPLDLDGFERTVPRGELAPLELPPPPWQLDVFNVVTERRIGGAVTVEDPAGDLLPETHFMPATLSGDWRGRKILLAAEGFRRVVVMNDAGEDRKDFMLCPIRCLHLEIRPPLEGEPECKVVLRKEGRVLQSYEVGAGEVRHEVLVLGAQREILAQVSSVGVAGAKGFLLEEPIVLSPAGNTTYVLQLQGLRTPDHGSLRTTLRFQDRVYGADTWKGTLYSKGSDEAGKIAPATAHAGWERWSKSSNGLQAEWKLDRVAVGSYLFRFEPLGIERELEIRAGESCELIVEAPTLGILEVGVRWASEHRGKPSGYQDYRVSFDFGETSVPDYVLGGARSNARNAEKMPGLSNLYRLSSPLGRLVRVWTMPAPTRWSEPVSHRISAGVQRVEIELHPAKQRVLGSSEPQVNR